MGRAAGLNRNEFRKVLDWDPRTIRNLGLHIPSADERVRVLSGPLLDYFSLVFSFDVLPICGNVYKPDHEHHSEQYEVFELCVHVISPVLV